MGQYTGIVSDVSAGVLGEIVYEFFQEVNSRVLVSALGTLDARMEMLHPRHVYEAHP